MMLPKKHGKCSLLVMVILIGMIVTLKHHKS